MINKQRLKSALTRIHEDENGRLYCSGRFIDLGSGLHLSIASGDETYGNLMRFLGEIHQDVWNLETIILRLDWQKELIAKGELNDIMGSMFSACDIDLFHVQYRSLFNRIAKIIGLLTGRPGTLPESFRRLRNWIRKPENAGRIDNDLAEFVASCDWFLELMSVRDSIVHRAGRTIVFPEKNRILFQVHEDYKKRLHIPEIMFNENVVDFELYAGMFVGYLLWYLEELSEIIERHVVMKKVGGDAQSYHSGLAMLRTWIERVCTIEPTAPSNNGMHPTPL